MATNTVNGKRYIGATKFTLEKRKSKHLYNAFRESRACGKFYNALRKYGSDAFTWTALATYDDVETAFRAEVSLINELNPEYNICLKEHSAGYFPAYNRKPVLCLEDGNVFPSITACASHYNADWSSLAELLKGRGTTASGRHFVYYTRDFSEQERNELISDLDGLAVQRRKRGGRNHVTPVRRGKDVLGRSAAGPMKSARPVICVTTGKEFPSASAAAAFYKVAKSAVIELCLKKNFRQTVGGLVFAYIDDNKERVA